MTTPRRLAAILAADVVGYSRLMAADEAGTLARFKLLRADHVEPAVQRFNGRIVGEAGDSLLVEFPTASDAVTCAVEVQEKLATLNAELPEERRMRFRVGVNLGEVIVDGSTIHGDGVNIAARLEKLADPGSVTIAHAVHELVKGKVSYRFEDLGEQELHNIADPIRAYRIAARNAGSGSMGKRAEARDDRVRVAVLPFTDKSGDAEQAYFSDELTEDLIRALARNRSLAVVAGHQSAAYKGRSGKVQKIGRELGAAYVVEGSVRRSAGRLRVAAQLVGAETGAHLWAERFDRDLKDVFAVQDEIVTAVAAQLTYSLYDAAAGRRQSARPENLAAHDHYWRGRAAWRVGNEAEARRHIERAVEADSKFATAFAFLAFIYAYGRFTGSTELPESEAARRAEVLAERAIAADQGDPVMQGLLAAAYGDLGYVAKALHHVEYGLTLSPQDIDMKLLRGYLLALAGDPKQGIAIHEESFWLEPRLPPVFRQALFVMRYMARDYESAIDEFEKLMEPPPVFFLVLAACFAQARRNSDAAAAIATFESRRLKGFDGPSAAHCFVKACKRSEDKEHWLEGFRKAGLVL